ncbi:hypothetical protein NMY22_g7941 [Coprinellus aureogranulatus]|nr:hypothetical protein NMY22_g7941 [Coprinellus aureogranulatus]
MHHPSSPRISGPSLSSSTAPEVPPRRKKRPESMQIGMLRRVSGGGGGGVSPFDDDLPTVDTDSQGSPTYATFGRASPTSANHLMVPPPLPPPRRKVPSSGNGG